MSSTGGSTIWTENRNPKTAKGSRKNNANVERSSQRHALHNSRALDPDSNYVPNSTNAKAKGVSESAYACGEYGRIKTSKKLDNDVTKDPRKSASHREPVYSVPNIEGKRISRREIVSKATASSTSNSNPQIYGRIVRKQESNNSSRCSSALKVSVPRPSTLPKSSIDASIYGRIRRKSSLPNGSLATQRKTESESEYGVVSKTKTRRTASEYGSTKELPRRLSKSSNSLRTESPGPGQSARGRRISSVKNVHDAEVDVNSMSRGRRGSAYDPTYATVCLEVCPVGSPLRAGTDRAARGSSTFPKSTVVAKDPRSRDRIDKLEKREKRSSFFSLFSKTEQSQGSKPDQTDPEMERTRSLYTKHSRKSSRTLLKKMPAKNSNTLPSCNRRSRETVPIDVPLYVRTTKSLSGEDYSRFSKFQKEKFNYGLGDFRAFSETGNSSSTHSPSIFGLCTGRRRPAAVRKSSPSVLPKVIDRKVKNNDWKVNTVREQEKKDLYISIRFAINGRSVCFKL